MDILNRKWLLVVVIFVALGILIAIIGWVSNERFNEQNKTVLPVVPPQVNNTNGLKTYTNTEFGFEFQYPENWSFEINSFYSPFSKFNLEGNTSDKSYNPFNPPFLINIVTPDFAQRAFSDLDGTGSQIIVGGIPGIRYEYLSEGMTEISIVLPLGEYKMILGAGKHYEDIFNQILATFKFSPK